MKNTKVAFFKKRNKFPNHVTALISELFLQSWLDNYPLAKFGKNFLQKTEADLETWCVPISSNFFENWDWNHVSTNHVTALITEQFLDSWSNPLSLVKFRKRILQKALSLFFYAVVFLCVKHAPSSPWIHDSQDVSMTRLLPYTCRGCELIVCLFVGLMFTSL